MSVFFKADRYSDCVWWLGEPLDPFLLSILRLNFLVSCAYIWETDATMFGLFFLFVIDAFVCIVLTIGLYVDPFIMLFVDFQEH